MPKYEILDEHGAQYTIEADEASSLKGVLRFYTRKGDQGRTMVAEWAKGRWTAWQQLGDETKGWGGSGTG